ncbi:unnamed protein product [Amoebophrya sp. A25]|nr:unnamed protein product [Amoebophrya sp. A25]|eukprot:GSA25T00010422001.1
MNYSSCKQLVVECTMHLQRGPVIQNFPLIVFSYRSRSISHLPFLSRCLVIY